MSRRTLKQRLLSLVENYRNKLGLGREDYKHLLEYTASKLGYDCKDMQLSSGDSFWTARYKSFLDKIKIPVKRKYGFLPNSKLVLKFAIHNWPLHSPRINDRISIPLFVDKKEAVSKLNIFIQECDKYKNILFPAKFLPKP